MRSCTLIWHFQEATGVCWYRTIEMGLSGLLVKMFWK